MNKVLITPKSYHYYKDKAFEMLRAKGYEPIENQTGRTLTEDEIIELAKEGVVGVIVGVDPMPARVLEQLKDVRAVSKYGMGVDNIDTGRAGELGIQVRAAQGTNNVSVAELAIGLIFAASRHLPAMSAKVKQGSWDRILGRELTGKTVGIVGGGQIGFEVAKRARGLEMDVSVYDPFLKDDAFADQPGIRLVRDLDALFASSDYISLHVPAVPDTYHLINARTLALMKPSAILINTSRGELIDEEALYDALVDGKLSGAAVDVFSSEPPQPGNKLVALDQFILTSHTGAFTYEAIEKMVLRSTINLLDMLEQSEALA
ncbi:phosphoglycerate dehydrogenase [Cohnella abietis]|uniref:2-hydroxyacid dehydrogenase n=1 Tax=Cohnella abietis TaxID=2507935 RepID=A0A3T1D404_9BACL|nr:phosphoglycerate dehydrogenase [Cohnella abietis]BBI32846.1 2-hydroxyacid dehydrogenase [Cohnella abietis]